ncbi:MAG: methionine--tRNA ligase [Gammaproteobacteria bacterium]|nr:methionine--tRNA ligase [Gammaproteobacteria bacterium]
MRKILVTSALPYANGPIHLGHILEMVQTDIWVRFQKLMGHECIYISADDAHGTPIMVYAEKQGISPEDLIAQVRREHQQDCKDFGIQFDYYGTTHSEKNRQWVETLYQHLKNQGHLVIKPIEQFYDPIKNIFLPDRFIKGECPICHASSQYGDSCEECGSAYASTRLVNPVSILSDHAPILKSTEHIFFKLSDFAPFLKEWMGKDLQLEVVHKLQEWFKEGLRDWDITRDAPYFGFGIPDRPSQYFYVWLDAPMGYLSSFQDLCDQTKQFRVEDFWGSESQAELYHFIGKDITYFHALFWPALLKAFGLRTPTNIFVHGFVTVNGEKMSKSKGTFIRARDYLDHLNPEYLRYYFASKLTSKVTEVDFNVKDFCQKVNADLVGKVVNIASRSSHFIHQYFEGRLCGALFEPQRFEAMLAKGEDIARGYERREYQKAIRIIMQAADEVNQWIDQEKPWKLVKDKEQLERVHGICSLSIELFRLITFYLKPVLPAFVSEVETFLNAHINRWEDRKAPLGEHLIHPFKPLLSRVPQESADALKEGFRI